MKMALQKDIVTSKKYVKDIQTCDVQIQEYISKKKDELVFQGILFISIKIKLFTCNMNILQ